MDKKRCDNALKRFSDIYDNVKESDDKMLGEYLEFSRFIQGLFIDEGKYIINTGNFQTCNRVLIHEIYEKIKKHPLIWKIFFEL